MDYKIPTFAELPDELHAYHRRGARADGPFGAKGVGEIGINGVAAAIANAVADATGVRLRALPLTPRARADAPAGERERRAMKLEDYPPQEPLSAARQPLPASACWRAAPASTATEFALRRRSLPDAWPSFRPPQPERRRARLLPWRRLDQRLQGVDGLHGAGASRRAGITFVTRRLPARAGASSFRPASRIAPTRSPGCMRHIGEHGGDPGRIFVGGHSAGGHYAALLAVHGRLAARARPACRCRARLPAALRRLPLRRRQRPVDAAALPRPGRRRRRRAAASPLLPASTPRPAALPARPWGSSDFPHLIVQAQADVGGAAAPPAAPSKHPDLLEGCDHFDASLACGEADGHGRPSGAWMRHRCKTYRSPTLTRRASMIRLTRRRRDWFSAASAAARSTGRAIAQADKPLRIGFSMARTGMLANATPSQINTYELWREQVNAARRHGRRRHQAQGRVRRSTTTSRSPSRRCASTRS